MKVAIAQINSSSDKQKNLDLIQRNVADAAGHGARLVVFPEATMAPFGSNLADAAEELDGPFAQRVRELAAEAGVVVAVGMFRPGSGGRVINTLFVTGVDASGERVEAHYDKIHLFDAFGHKESDAVVPGDALVAVNIDGVTVGLTICYDVRFPALYTSLARAGADVIVCSISWGSGEGKVEQLELLGRARALDSTTYVVGCDQADTAVTGAESTPGSPNGVGHSFVAGPDGNMIASAGSGVELLVVDLDVDAVAPAREKLPVLQNSRLESENRVRVM
ncbi:carbon-nitrogen hydrolase family protein [Pseudoglutamicibacter albus]|uniref:carbon-nitrogen hydrolase family protein n=1 Tax=Pseudoglutamicibacter albus TaxID=98671 RepID=UPI001EF443C8|nr:carbon-nitrogen hydrolase family protein [Pseudoglutamicibacter albus]